MKRHLLFILMMMLPIVASAYIGEIVVDDVKYSISTKEQTAKAIGLSNPDYSGAIVIHGVVSYEGKDCYVSEVLINGFTNCTGITSLTIEEGVTTIARRAFYNCSNLSEISLPKTVENIDTTAFGGTAWFENQAEGIVYLSHIAYTYKGDKTCVTDMTLKEGISVIAIKCFSGLKALQTVNLPSTLSIIGEQSFSGCSSLSSITLQNLELGNNAFKDCVNLKEVSLSNVSIVPYRYGYGLSPFSGCIALEKVSVNCKETTQGFENLPSITTLILGEDIESIADGTFEGCTGIKNVVFPQKLKYLSGFSGCTGLTSIQIPSCVEEIGKSAFEGCIGLTSLIIPKDVKIIHHGAFRGCTNLSDLKLSEGLEIIGGSAFSRIGVSQIVIPNSVKTIGVIEREWEGYSFSSCENLTTIIFPNKNIHLGDGTFENCKKIEYVTLPEGLHKIPVGLFRYCNNLQTVHIPSSIDSIGGSAFEGCKALESVYCYSPNIPTIIHASNTVDNPFYSADIQYATLYVPVQSIDSYKAALYWKDFKEIVPIPGYDAKKCATPQISYTNGKLSFSCDTDGASFSSEIKDTDIKKYNVSEIDLSVSYNIQVFATASGCAPSDTVRATLCWLDATPTVIGIDNIRQEKISANPVLIQTMDGTIYIKGLENGTKVYAYDTEGLLKGSVRCKGEECYLPTNIRKGSVAILKIGERSIKIIMQ